MNEQLELLPRRRIVLAGDTLKSMSRRRFVLRLSENHDCFIAGEPMKYTEWSSKKPPCAGWWNVYVTGWAHPNMMFWKPETETFEHDEASPIYWNAENRTVVWRGLTQPPRCGYDYDVPAYPHISASKARRKIQGL